MRKLKWLAAVAIALVIAGAAALFFKEPIKRLISGRVTAERERLRREEPPLSRLEVSQVGYGPAMRKRFTSPKPFGSFAVEPEAGWPKVFESKASTQRTTNVLGDVGTVWLGDFSAVTTPGRYRVVADNGLRSDLFDVGPDVFAGPLRAVQRGFYFQRAFTAIDAAHAEGPWQHPSDASLAPYKVQMGWHDAGDLSIYSASLNAALFWMLETYSDFSPSADDTNLPESGNKVPDLLDEARWGVSWLLSVQEATGGFRNTTCEWRYGPYGTNFPDKVEIYRAGEISTLATARAVGNLAYASSLYRKFDPELATRMLTAAKNGYQFLSLHPESSDGPTCPAYRADGDSHVGNQTRMFAAAGMLLATGEPAYAADFDRYYVELDYDPSYMNVNGFAARLYLRAQAGAPERKKELRQRLQFHAGRVRAAGAAHPFELSAPTHWGSIGAGFTRVDAYSIPPCLEDPKANAADCEQALANVHYLFGRNSLGLAFVSGLRGVTHGRQHAFHHWFAALQATPWLPPGMVAGGPNSAPERADTSNPLARPIAIWGYFGDPAWPRDDRTPADERFTDNDSWSTNEVSIDWQASTLYALYFADWAARGYPR
jgi:endoglucanase